MAQQNTDNIQQNLNRRDIRRNSSNQIVSYSIPDTDDLTYGIQKIPVIQTRFEKDSYNKTIEMLSDEFITPLPDVPLEVIKTNYISERRIYKNGQPNPEFTEEFNDIFSGRYELTDGARTHTGWRDTHTINPVTLNADGRARGLSFSGYDVIPFDNAVMGPGLEDGGYRITKELIDSGKSIRLKTVIGVANETTSPIQFYISFRRDRAPWSPMETFEEDVQTYSAASYRYMAHRLDVENSDMKENDIWSVQMKVNSNLNTFLYGGKALFEVEIYDGDNPAGDWPRGTVDKFGSPVSLAANTSADGTVVR